MTTDLTTQLPLEMVKIIYKCSHIKLETIFIEGWRLADVGKLGFHVRSLRIFDANLGNSHTKISQFFMKICNGRTF